MNPSIRAWSATVLFSAAAAWSLLFHAVPWEFVLPHVIFYATLTVNTFFSVRFYTAFVPETPFQTFIDLALAAAYISLALTIGIPMAFVLSALLIFTLAPAKYAHLLGKTPYDATLRKKILIDVLGNFMCVCGVVLTVMGQKLEAAWVMAILFAIANVVLLLLRPMYRHV